MKITFPYPTEQGTVEVTATVSHDGEAGSLSVPLGWWVDEIVARQDGRIVELNDADYQAALVRAVKEVT